MYSFSHSGNLGDIVFSLHFCKELMEYKQEHCLNFHIQTNVSARYSDPHPYINVRMTELSAKMLKPLLEYQDYINEVTFSNKIPENYLNLDYFRNQKLNFFAGDIRSWYYVLTKKHLPRKFYEKTLFAPVDKTYENKIIIANTERYQNFYIDYKLLKPFEDNLVFCGAEYEYIIFKNKSHVNCEYRKINDFLEFASIVEGAKGFIANQSGLYSIVECMKCPRILITPEFIYKKGRTFNGPVNNHPIGGWNEVAATNSKLISSIENLLNI